MDPALESASAHLLLIPEHVQGNTLRIKGINCQPIAFRILSETEETHSPLQTHEIATMAMIDGRAQKVALSVQALSGELGLTIEEIKNAVKKRKGFDGERLTKKSDRRQQRIEATNLSPEALASIKEVAKKIIAKFTPSSKQTAFSPIMIRTELPISPLRNKRVTLLFNWSSETKPEILIQIGRLGSGGMGEVTKWLHLKTLEQAALKVPLDATNSVKKRELIESEARLLEEISQQVQQQNVPSVGIQLPPHTISPLQNVSEIHKSFSRTGVQTFGFLGHVYRGDMLSHYAEFSPQQKYRAATQLTRGLDLLHSIDRPHGDIKLENVLFDNEHFYLADFGDGKTIQEKEKICKEFHHAILSKSPNLTKKINGVGTFLHPNDIGPLMQEVERRRMATFQEIKKASDIYALGISLLYLFNEKKGRTIYTRHNEAPAMYAELDQISQQQAPFETVGLLPEQESLILRMLDPDWRQRPTAAEVSRTFPIENP